MQVKSVKYFENSKIFKLANGKFLGAHRFCCIGAEDEVVVGRDGSVTAKCLNGRAKILPIYKSPDSILFGSKRLNLLVKEIETSEEITGYHQLEAFHYRGKAIHGRRVPLVATTTDPLLPKILGYVELATSFLMSKPRMAVLNDKFEDGLVSWNTWDKSATRHYTNLTVRIARCVVSPEFRGLGIAGVLTKHAARFAKNHWNVGKLKPHFLEITADMLRYIPFVESAGMHYIGDTEGNLARVNKDMDYILKNYARVRSREILKEESAGIVDLQVSYAAALKAILKDKKLSKDKLLELLLKAPEKLSDTHWGLLHKIFRLPKPTFMMGLTPAAEKFVVKRVAALALPRRFPSSRPKRQRPSRASVLEAKECTFSLQAPLIKTKATRKIQQAFGVSREMLVATPFSGLNFKIGSGEVVLLCGPSGAGKTTLLNLITKKLLKPHQKQKGLFGEIKVNGSFSVRSLGTLSNSQPLVNALGNVPLNDALYALNVSGLAEAHLYVKRFKELSNGQRYRAMVAKLIASKADIWIADEYCATLDPITANIVSRNLRRCAKKYGVTVILAAANWSEFIHELQPDKVIHLRAPWDYRVFDWQAFNKAFSGSSAMGTAFKSEALSAKQ